MDGSGTTLVVWDFDWSLINENSDTYVFQELAPRPPVRAAAVTLPGLIRRYHARLAQGRRTVVVAHCEAVAVGGAAAQDAHPGRRPRRRDLVQAKVGWLDAELGRAVADLAVPSPRAGPRGIKHLRALYFGSNSQNALLLGDAGLAFPQNGLAPCGSST